MNKSSLPYTVPVLIALMVMATHGLATNYIWPSQAKPSHSIGFGADTDTTSTGSIAIASCDGHASVRGAVEACQIGTGSNTTDGSFQYRSTVIIDGDGGLGIRMYGLMYLKYIFWADDFQTAGYVANSAATMTNLPNRPIPQAHFSEVANGGAWLVSIVDTGGDNDEIIRVQDAGHGGILYMETTDTALDSIEAQLNGESFQIQVGEEAWFNSRWAVEDADQNTNVIGLALSDTDVIDSLPNDHILFMGQGSNLYFSVGQNGTAWTFDTGVVLEDATYVVTSWYYDGAGTIAVTVDGTLISNVVDNGTTIVFPDDQAISPVMGKQTTDTGKDYMLVDYIGCWLER